MLAFITTIPVLSSVILISADLPTTIERIEPSTFAFSIVRSSSISNLPFAFALMSEISATLDAVPPTWKVRSVN